MFLPKAELELIKNFRPRGRNYETKDKFPNITKQFWKFLQDQKNDPESCFICVTIGMRRIGKTAFSFSEINDILEYDKTRELCLFKAPKVLLEEVSKIFPGRVYAVEELIDVRNNCILYVDEALLELNAKLATTTALRKFGQSLVKTSHKRIILIVCAQDDGFMKDLRKKADLVIYKRLIKGFVDEAPDKFIKENAHFLLRMPREQAIVFSNYYHYNETVKINGEPVFTGLIDIDLKEHCPWWSDKISKNLSDESLDRDYEQSKKDILLIKEVAQTMIDIYGKNRMIKGKTQKLMKGYYLANNLKKYNRILGRTQQIEEFLVYLCTDQLSEAEKKEDEKEKYELPPEIEKSGMTFAQYALFKFPNKIGKIFSLLFSGWKQEDIAKALRMNKADVSQLILSYSEREIGYWLEEWFSLRMGGGPTGGNSNAPDYIDALGRVFSCKYRYNRKNTQTFFQETQKPWLKPEHDYCVDNLVETYFIVYLNPYWKENCLKILEVKTFGDDAVKVNINYESVIEIENFFE